MSLNYLSQFAYYPHLLRMLKTCFVSYLCVLLSSLSKVNSMQLFVYPFISVISLYLFKYMYIFSYYLLMLEWKFFSFFTLLNLVSLFDVNFNGFNQICSHIKIKWRFNACISTIRFISVVNKCVHTNFKSQQNDVFHKASSHGIFGVMIWVDNARQQKTDYPNWC